MKRQFEDFDKLCFLPVVVRWLHDFLSKRRLAAVEKWGVRAYWRKGCNIEPSLGRLFILKDWPLAQTHKKIFSS